MRLILLIKKIEWEVTQDEESAFLRENQLIRLHRPHFNRVNKSPELYLFLHLKLEDKGIRFLSSMEINPDFPDVYGAFRSVRLTWQSMRALLRLMWGSYHGCKNEFEFPPALLRDRKLERFYFPFPEFQDSKKRRSIYTHLRRYFKGTSKTILHTLALDLLGRSDLTPFLAHFYQADFDTALLFHERCAKKNKRLIKLLNLPTSPISQIDLDDHMVKYRSSSLNRKENKKLQLKTKRGLRKNQAGSSEKPLPKSSPKNSRSPLLDPSLAGPET